MKNNILTSLGNKKDIPNIINNPFGKSCIERINLTARKKLSGDGVLIFGSVGFKNGMTEAEQRFEASSLTELLLKIYEFCNTLPE